VPVYQHDYTSDRERERERERDCGMQEIVGPSISVFWSGVLGSEPGARGSCMATTFRC
jgi:hypothetical protein